MKISWPLIAMAFAVCTVVKGQTLRVFVEDSPQGILVTVNGSLTNIDAFGSYTERPPVATVASLSAASAISMFGSTASAFKVFSDVQASVDLMAPAQVTLTGGQVSGNVPILGLFPTQLYLDSSYTAGTEVDGSILFVGETLESNRFVPLAQANVSADGGTDGTQTVSFQIGLIADTTSPSAVPSAMPFSGPDDEDEDDCPCGRFQLICRIMNGCLFPLQIGN